jgi:2-oxoglutarate dehydrogenase E1 component
MYKHWKRDPSSVHASWQAYFSGLDKGLSSQNAFQPPPDYTGVPMAADGAPSLHVGSGALTDHLKVSVMLLD